MEIETALIILKRHNRWRRGDESLEMEHPAEVGVAIDTLVEFVENTLKRDQNG